MPHMFLNSRCDEKEQVNECLKNLENLHPTIIVKNKKDSRFNDAKRKEVSNLANKGTYEIVQENKIPEGSFIIESRFVLCIKNFSEPDELYKIRLVILCHINSTSV